MMYPSITLPDKVAGVAGVEAVEELPPPPPQAAKPLTRMDKVETRKKIDIFIEKGGY
jgi:hypothetical protein